MPAGRVQHRLALVKPGLAQVKRADAVVDLALMPVVLVLAARELGLTPEENYLDTVRLRRRGGIEHTLRIVNEHLFTIQPELMYVRDDLLQIENPLLPIDAQLQISRTVSHSYGG